MHEDEGFDDTNSGGDEQTKPLKKQKAVKLQLFRTQPGKLNPNYYDKSDNHRDKIPLSKRKSKWSSGTVAKVNVANKTVTVLWDGDKEGVD